MDTKKNQQSLMIGVTGLVLQVGGMIAGGFTQGNISPSNPDFAMILIAWAAICIGTGLLIWGMCLYAQAKEQSGWWGLLGVLGIIGLIVLSVLPDRDDKRRRAQKLNPDITQPPGNDSVQVNCMGCDYMLNGVTSGACPECGRAFDPNNLATVRVNDPSHAAIAPWTARWSLICGVLGSITFCAPPLGIIIPGLGVLFGHLAIPACKKLPGRPGFGVSIAGLVVSYVTLLMGIGVLAFFLMAITR